MPDSDRRVRADSEFAPLRTVVVSQSEFRAPDAPEVLGHSMPVEASAVEILEAVWGRDFGAAYPEQRAWQAERDELAAVLGRHGGEMLRPRLFAVRPSPCCAPTDRR